MPPYTARHAGLARRQLLLDQGHAESESDVWTTGGWLDDGPDRFTRYDGSDPEPGKAACKVQFLNGDGDAEVTLADGNGGVVNIGEDEEDDTNEEEELEEDDPEEIEEDPDDDEAEEDEDS
jgi:hypothetical protein